MKCSVCCTAEATAVSKDGNVYRVLCDWCADKHKEENNEDNKAKCDDN